MILLSGACLPCRPVASLERFLAENAGREFIESEDESWITGGWRSERWRFWHCVRPQDPAPRRAGSRRRIQAALRVRRRFPAGLEPRFGSQWWALTWPAVQAILADIRRNPKRLGFFRTVWIPDEMVFQTYVAALVPRGAIAGFGLTHFQFTNRGKPVVYHEDHAAYVRTLDRFFFRKISPEAKRLRAACLARAAEPDDGADLDRIGAPQDHYRLKLAAQTRYAPPGALFFRDQFVDRIEPVLAAARDPYLVVVGPPALARRLAGRLPEPPFAVLGEIFAPEAVDLGRGRAELGGLRRERHGDPRPAPGALAGPGARPRRPGGGGAGDPLVAGRPAPAARRGAARPGGAGRRPAAALRRPGARPRRRCSLRSLGPGRDAGDAGCRSGCRRRSCAPRGARRRRRREPRHRALAGRRGGAARAPPDLRAPDLVLPWGGDPGAGDPRRAAGPSSPPRSPPAASATPPGSRRSPRRSPPPTTRTPASPRPRRRRRAAAPRLVR